MLNIQPIARGAIRSMNNDRRQSSALAANRVINALVINPRFGFESYARRWESGQITLNQVGNDFRHYGISNWDTLAVNQPNYIYNFVREQVNEAIMEFLANYLQGNVNRVLRANAILSQRLEDREQRVSDLEQQLAALQAQVNQAAEHYIMDDQDALVELLEETATNI